MTRQVDHLFNYGCDAVSPVTWHKKSIRGGGCGVWRCDYRSHCHPMTAAESPFIYLDGRRAAAAAATCMPS
jgi:hypothetical protein